MASETEAAVGNTTINHEAASTAVEMPVMVVVAAAAAAAAMLTSVAVRRQ